MKEDNDITRFCKATSARKEEALYFLEGFNGNLEAAISGFLRNQLPPVKKPSPPWKVTRHYRSRSPLRPIYSTPYVSEYNLRMYQDEITIMNSSNTAGTSLDDSRELHDVFHGEKMVSICNPVAYEFVGKRSAVKGATKICGSTSTEIDLPYSDPDSGSD